MRTFIIDRLPEIGAAGGGAGASMILITWQTVLASVVSAFIFAVVGGVVGYILKILLDKLFKKK